MGQYRHSVTLDREKCKGCTNCIKRCPTEAIRFSDGKARIIDERCIDCGECIRVCPYHAKVAVTDPLSAINNFKYKIALPAPALYGQFENIGHPGKIVAGLKMLGFDDVYEVARAADYVSAFIKGEMGNLRGNKPLISSACPAIERLIQVRFPELIKNIIPIASPMEIAAQIAKRNFCEQKGVEQKEVGVFFITPCAAKMTAVKNPIGMVESFVDGCISIMEIYGALGNEIKKVTSAGGLQMATAQGIGWANSGGEGRSLKQKNFLAVDGIHNVIQVLEQIENGKLQDLDFLEGLACVGGCVGGPLVFENAFVAQNRVRKLLAKAKGTPLSDEDVERQKASVVWKFQTEITPNPVMKLAEDISEAIRRMEEMNNICEDLPGMDCGSCGSPSCRTLAEDIVRGHATEMDCIFKLKEKVKNLAQEMIELAEKIPMGKDALGKKEISAENQKLLREAGE